MTAIADLDLFARVARTGNMSAAGRELGLSPAVVSKRISMLESEIGARLFQRTTRQLTLTDVGEGFFRRVVDILNLAEEAYDFVSQSGDSPKGVLQIACSRMIHRSVLVPQLAPFAARCPEIELEIDLYDGEVDVIGEGYDLALLVGRAKDESCIVHAIRPVELIVCATAGYLARHGEPRTIDELGTHLCLGAAHGSGWHLHRGGKSEHVVLPCRYRSDSYELMRDAMLAGIGLALLPAIDIEKELAGGLVRRVLADWHGDPAASVIAVQASKEYVPAKVTALVEHLLLAGASEPGAASASTPLPSPDRAPALSVAAAA